METNEPQALQKAGLKMAKQYGEMEKEALRLDPETTNWPIMPKIHPCQHLCEMGVPVKDFWTYKDETMGGTLAFFSGEEVAKTTPATMPVKFWTDGNAQLLSLLCNQEDEGCLHMPHASM